MNPFNTRTRIDAELQKNERLLWTTNHYRPFWEKKYVVPFIFGICWIVLITYALFVTGDSPLQNPEYKDKIPLLLVAVVFYFAGITIIRQTYKKWNQHKIESYVITNQRAMIMYPKSTKVSCSIPLQNIKNIKAIPGNHTEGELILNPGQTNQIHYRHISNLEEALHTLKTAREKYT